MSKAVVIVESPTKIKTISKFLGDKYKVVSSMGHLIDLPKSTFGVDIEKKFAPKMIVVRSKQKYLNELKKVIEKAEEIYVATDPDREGEAIGWNLMEHLGEGKKIYRVTFQEITKEAVLKAFQNPREFDKRKVDAQMGRRILDRIVGYKISPLLWKKVGSRLSAGRVQSVALRLIVDREGEINKFNPQEYWQIAADFQKQGQQDFLEASLEKVEGKDFKLDSQSQAHDIVEKIKKETAVVSNVAEKEVKRNPAAPHITSTLQQEAFNRLKFNANRTMMIAQELYEGLELGDGESVGLITYMRTDSVNISEEAIGRVRNFIEEKYGKEYLPEVPNKYKSKKSAQEAHEAIRPSDVFRKPDDIKNYLTEDQYKLYSLIWNRFVSCQMKPAISLQKKIEITAGQFQFGVSGSTLLFDGFLAIQREEKEEEKKVDLSPYKKSDQLKIMDVRSSQHFTKPPPRYSDASLVKALEEDGIGRPSTYASIIQTLALRNYVQRQRGYFTPTELGIKICNLLMEYFARIMDISFTAKMEESLDLVEEGKLKYPKLLAEFYAPFEEELKYAESHIKKTPEYVDKHCPQCGSQLVVKWGRRGKFLSCSGFPKCKHAESFTLGIPCPQEGCGGELVERQSKMRQIFYGCSRYPQCTYIAKELPKTTPNPPVTG